MIKICACQIAFSSNNLVSNLKSLAAGNSKFNLILMCWPEGISSTIHDHQDSHCFMRILEGEAKETR